MIARSIARSLLPGLLLAACSTTVAPTPTTIVQPPASPTPTAAPTEANLTPGPTDDAQPLPTTSLFGWWEDSPHYGCHPAAWARVDGKVSAFGVCPGPLSDTPRSITVEVGQDIELHMAVHQDGGAPIYPLPAGYDPLVVRGWLITDKATMTYRALSPGTTRLVTVGDCWISDNSPTGVHDVNGPCPVVEIHVKDIPTRCISLETTLCRVIAAQAVLGLFPEPGQRVVGWVAEAKDVFVGGDCGTWVATVKFTLAAPAGDTSVSIGRYESEPGREKYVVCTY